jgi:tetratricopeptide (TPR) repeat protein
MHLRQRYPALHIALRIGVLLAAFLVILYAKVAYNARQDFTLGEDAYTHGEYKRAIIHYERTIKWYTPWSTVVPRAVERLWQLGTEAEARGEVSLALEAYQALRSSLYAVQSLYIPYQRWIPKSEERIAPLLAKTKAGEKPNADKLQQDTARFAMQLQRHVGPHLGWSILVEIGFLGWVGATVGLIWYVVDEAGNFARRQGVLWGSLMAVCFALWLIGMRLT